jgi:hypothetical protein
MLHEYFTPETRIDNFAENAGGRAHSRGKIRVNYRINN